MTIRLYEVGGAVRDSILDIQSKDVDFAVEAESYDAMRQHLVDDGFEIFVETPEFLTIRARPPRGGYLAERTKGADFVLCRKDSPGSDGRRPDYVEPGTIYDDLARRDFTMNAIAIAVGDHVLIDPHGGATDLRERTLRFVGDPMVRIREDGLRVARGLRFMITRGMQPTQSTWAALVSDEASHYLSLVSVERIYDEIGKMFRFDTIESIGLIDSLPYSVKSALFRGNLHLDASLRG